MYSKKNVSYVAFRTSNAITAVIELNALCIFMGAELASATVPWHWLYFALPRSGTS